MFNDFICQRLQKYTTRPPRNKNHWHGPWLAILNTLFPYSRDYMITPLSHAAQDNDHTPYFVFEVSKSTTVSGEDRTVLIVAIMHYLDWKAGIPLLETEINRQADIAFSRTFSRSNSKVYWIGVLGPHWQYGVKDNGQELKPLIAWHDTTHDASSYDDFTCLAALIEDM